MNLKRNIIGTLGLLLFLASCGKTPDPPAPYGQLPNQWQLEWQKMEYYMFIHFGPNTFTNVEWGHGKEDPKVFNPTHLDCRQWAATAKAAGMKAIIITAKHHDGFCLWPSQYSTHTVRESAWKEGKGDLLKELSEACKEYGLKFGVYLSPWDQNHPSYGTPEYNQIFSNTLKEVLGNYGHVFEQWFDGACGEGPNGKLQEYDWDLFHKTVYDLQPHAIIFSDVGPGCRWMGNERGVAGETNWSTLNIKGFGPGKGAPPRESLSEGNMNGEKWIPAETDVSIRPGWFYSPTTDNRVKSVSKLVDIYHTSVGRNSNLLLNVPPDKRGLIHPNDSARLMEFRKVIDESYAVNLAKGAKGKAGHVRGNARKYAEKNLFDGNYDTYWTTDDGQLSVSVEIDLKNEESFNRLVLQEYIPLGQRVKSFSVEYWDEGKWKQLDRQTTIGYKRILRFPMITTKKIRVNIEESLASPVLNEIGVYKAVEILEMPVITRNKKGEVSIGCESSDPVVYYTVDGSEPTPSSERYTSSFPLVEGGIVSARAFINDHAQSSETVKVEYDLTPMKWKVVSPAIPGIERAVDGNPASFASIPAGQQKEITIDLGEELLLKGFSYTPVDGSSGNIYRYSFYISPDGKKWTKVKNNASFDNIKNNPVQQFVRFDDPVKGRFIKLEVIELTDSGRNVTIGELGVITR
ncbi:MAG: alpha-L-fucosidase [Bacteroidales bacterium]|jgi:alpha-L-fucosidase|nr:alpha-L-fucosidase [Bacteroidales bacterium]